MKEIKVTKYYCKECGSSDVEEKAWVKVNTGQIESVIEDSEVWCCQCEKETSLEEK